jgi:hypothetical protein
MADKIENPFKYGTDPELNRIFDNLLSLQVRVAERFAKAEKIAGLTDVSAFVPLQDVKIDLPNYRYERTRNNYSKTPLDQIENMVRPAVESARKKIAEIEEANKPLEEQNMKLVAQVKELMARIGIPGTYSTYEYPTSRSKTKKSVTHTAGFVGDLERTRPKSNVQSAKYHLDSFVRDYETWVRAEKEAEHKAKIEKDELAVQKHILGNPVLVATLMQAGVNILEEVQKAMAGQKSEVINYCKARAIANIRAQAEPDEDLVEKIQDL